MTPFSHAIEDYPEGIILPVDKPYRWTSADVIRKIKFAAVRHFHKKNLKVGHAGTLDPLATGVLLVCIGPATKRADELQRHDKEYVAGISFGATTPSYDLEKEIDRRFPTDGVTEDALRTVLPQFLGEQEQVAPLFSAKSVDGVRAYELARKLYRQRFSVSPTLARNLPEAQTGDNDDAIVRNDIGPERFDEAAAILTRNRINIREFELLRFDPHPAEMIAPGVSGSVVPDAGASAIPSATVASGPDIVSPGPGDAISGPGDAVSGPGDADIPGASPFFPATESRLSPASARIKVQDIRDLDLPLAEIRIACSKGTYIRAFARDLGEALGTGAFLDSLRRTRTGDYRAEDALTLADALALFA